MQESFYQLLADVRRRGLAVGNRNKHGEGKPETFNFLGFTHIFGNKRSNGRFTVLRQTIRKRLQAKLGEVKAELRRCMHDPIPEVGQWPSARSSVDTSATTEYP